MDLQRNVVEVTIARGSSFDLRGIPEAVRSAGFKPGWMWVRCNDAGSQAIVRLDTRMPNPSWEPETRDLRAVFGDRGH